MTTVLTDNANYTAIANAIRSKLGVQTTYMPSEMADAITAIPTGGGSDLGTKTITTNGTYNASDDSLDGFSSVTVNVSSGQPSFPTGYSQLKYVESSSGAYIAINNRTLTTNDKILILCKRTSPDAHSESVFGMDTSFTFYFSNAEMKYITAYNNCVSFSVSYPSSSSVELEVNGGLYQYRGRTTGTCQGNIYIGCYDGRAEYFVGNIGVIAVFTQDETFTPNYSILLIPCVRTSDSVVGFYDVIGEEFYTNHGSGSFTAGPYVA